MEIETKNLQIREFSLEDTQRVAELLNNINVTKWLLVFPNPFNISDAEKSINYMIMRAKECPRTGYNMAIELKSNGLLIGNVSLVKIDYNHKVGSVMYWLGEDYWNKGYGSEALKALLDFGFKELKLRRISAEVYPGNEGSSKLLEKFGFKKEGYFREAVVCKADNQIKDTIPYGLLSKEYIAS
jgi:RimJ/RimL family protein N-acetyltransferase